VLNRLVSLFDSLAGLFRLFVRCGCRFLRGWWSLGNGLSRFHGRRRGDGGRRGRCNRNWRILLRLAKVLTRAQENAHDKGQAGYDKERDPFRRERAPLRQGLPRYFQIHARIMAQPGLSIHRGIFHRRPSKIGLVN
jgi:hypothetical protein